MIAALRGVAESARRFSARLADDAQAIASLRTAFTNASEDAAKRALSDEKRDFFLLAKRTAESIDPSRTAGQRIALASHADAAETGAKALEASGGQFRNIGATAPAENFARLLLSFEATRRAVEWSLADNAKVIEALRLALASMPRR